MDTPWWDKSHAAFELARFWKTSSGRTFVAASEILDQSRRVVAVYDLSAGGKAVFAWGGDGCVASVRSAYEDQIMVLVSNTGAATGYDAQLWWGAPEQVATALSPSFTFKFSDTGFVEFDNATLGDGVLGWEVTSIHEMDLASKKQTQVIPNPVASAFLRRFVGNTLFWGSAPVPVAPFWRAWVSPFSGTPVVLLAPANAHVRGLDTDGTTIGWLQLSDQTATAPDKFATCDLYSAPYATDPGGLQPTRLTKIDSCANTPPWIVTQLHHGFFGMESGNGALGDRVYSLMDGSYYLAPTVPTVGMVNTKQLWADDQEIVIQASDATYQLARTIVRLPLAGLGKQPPTP